MRWVGYLVGVLIKKVGKVLAFVVVAAFALLQVLASSDLIDLGPVTAVFDRLMGDVEDRIPSANGRHRSEHSCRYWRCYRPSGRPEKPLQKAHEGRWQELATSQIVATAVARRGHVSAWQLGG